MSLLTTLRACAAALLIACGASVSQAATVDVSFNFVGHRNASVGSGAFSYDSGKTGTIGFGDLKSFSLDLLTDSFDLDFVNDSKASFSKWWGFGFDTESLTFVSQTVAGYPFIMAALLDSFQDGFFVRNDVFNVVRDYPNGDRFYTQLDISVSESRGGVSSVPLPAPILLFAAALAALPLLRLRRRRRPEAV